MRSALWCWWLFSAVLLCARVADAQLLSPGDLSKPHASIDGDEHCLDCHSSGKRVDVARCTHCHADLGKQISAHAGLHGKTYAGKPCEQCHIEHRGRGFELVRWPGGSRDKLDHAQTGWPLQGGHQRVKCNDCHTKKNVRGAPTFLGLQTSCTSCHEDPHDKRLGSECTKCHDEQSWKRVRLQGFDHALARFALRGKHSEVQCAKCHGSAPDTKYRGLQFNRCTDCHKDPHDNRFGSDCTSCHKETSWSEVSMGRGSHPGLSLGGGHAQVKCETCHDRGSSQKPTKGSRCVGCHAPVHEAPFGNSCEECHERVQWLGLPEAIGRKSHARTVFPLRGEHQEVKCEDCHKSSLPRAQRYRKLSYARCSDCHADKHAGEFTTRDQGECAPCHDERGFAPTLFGSEAHASTTFPLEGRHVAVPCSSCHKTPAPRLDFHVAQAECASCHADPHAGQFAREMQDGGCAHCHSASGWHAPKIDHRSWPLTGAHATAQCGSCHTRTAEGQGAMQAASYRGVARECEGCHRDPHAGQFRLSDPVRSCKDCHGTTQFRIEPFDHNKTTGYTLDGEHTKLKCFACHAKEKLRNGESTARFRLGYRKCGDCHRDPHAPEAAP